MRTDRLLQGGWTLHMAAPYNKASTSRDLDPGKGEWLCIAARKAGTDVLVVAAMAKRADVLRKTSGMTQAFESNGVFWYHWPGKSFGFSRHPKVQFNNVNVEDTDGEYRLSWFVDYYSYGGWRAGNITGQYTSAEYEKLVFYLEMEGTTLHGTALHAAACFSKELGST